eukprot:443252-Amphidinium_carterae.1
MSGQPPSLLSLVPTSNFCNTGRSKCVNQTVCQSKSTNRIQAHSCLLSYARTNSWLKYSSQGSLVANFCSCALQRLAKSLVA